MNRGRMTALPAALRKYDLNASHTAGASRLSTAANRSMAISKVDAELQIVYGEVYAPDFPDSQGDYMSRETIREMAFEFNIERAAAANNEASNTGPGGLRQTIIDLIAERAALDMEELALLGDTGYTSGNADDQAYLSQLDGWLKKGAEQRQCRRRRTRNHLQGGLQERPEDHALPVSPQ